MRVTNFLPDDYLQRRGLRRANWMCVGIAAGTLVLLGAVVAFVLVRSWGIAGVRLLTEVQYQEASRQIEDLKQLEARKVGLLHKVELSTALLERVPRSHVLARLTNHLPEHTSLTSMTMQLEETKVKVDDPADGAAGGKKPRGARGKNQPGVARITRLRFRLDGLAETDVQVAEYISRLHTDPLFEAVDLQFSEEFPYKEGVTMRRFQMSLLLSEDAEKVLESLGDEPAGVADSSPTDTKGNL
ncbi:MAG TPA: PilN domain-containing protein [Phycisphaerae bacterium]|nr:PilN domain-containing protein [Phycisphaerae bacterium]